MQCPFTSDELFQHSWWHTEGSFFLLLLPSEIWWFVSICSWHAFHYLFFLSEDCWEVCQLQHWDSHFQSGSQSVFAIRQLHLFLIMWHYLHDKQCQLIYLHSLLQSQYPRIDTEDFSLLPIKKSGKDGWLVSLLSYYKVTISSSDYSNEISHWLVDNLCWRLSDIVWSIHH